MACFCVTNPEVYIVCVMVCVCVSFKMVYCTMVLAWSGLMATLGRGTRKVLDRDRDKEIGEMEFWCRLKLNKLHSSKMHCSAQCKCLYTISHHREDASVTRAKVSKNSQIQNVFQPNTKQNIVKNVHWAFSLYSQLYPHNRLTQQ